jgi:hypothetical protein
VRDLLLAVPRRDRLGTDHKQEAIALLDGHPQGSRKDLSVSDLADVDPDVLAARLQRLNKPRDQGAIMARIGDEHVAQRRPPGESIYHAPLQGPDKTGDQAKQAPGPCPVGYAFGMALPLK